MLNLSINLEYNYKKTKFFMDDNLFDKNKDTLLNRNFFKSKIMQMVK
jgi:hypothetical protein